MTTQEIQTAINEQQSIILDRQARLSSKDYIDNKVVDTIIQWARSGGTLAELKESVTTCVASYEGTPQDKEQWRSDINAAQQRISELEAEVPGDVDTDKNKDAEWQCP